MRSSSSSTTEVAGDSWYPAADGYWVPESEAGHYPLRYGDVCATPNPSGCVTADGKHWARVMVLHPSCELGAKSADHTEVVVGRINPVTSISARQRPPVRVGWSEAGGVLRVAHANTFWMPPTPDQDDDVDWYLDFQRVVRVPLIQLRAAGRMAAMTHDARLALIRRELYYRYRWLVSPADVMANEATRIPGDRGFLGPRPSWAPPA